MVVYGSELLSAGYCEKCRARVPADWQTCRVCGTAIAHAGKEQNSAAGQGAPIAGRDGTGETVAKALWRTTSPRAILVVILGVAGFLAIALTIWISRQGYAGGHIARIGSEENQPLSLRFHDQATADEFGAAGTQVQVALAELNRLNREASPEVEKRYEQIPAILAAVDRYEEALGKMQAVVQKALDEKYYMGEKDRHKLEVILTVLEIRKKVSGVDRRMGEKILLAKDHPEQISGGGVNFKIALREFVEEMYYKEDRLVTLKPHGELI